MRFARRAAAIVIVFGTNAAAQGAPPWVPEHRASLPDDARSAAILARDEPIFTTPNATGPRRGAAAVGARLPIYGAATGPGCHGDWLMVGALAWICSDRVGVSPEPPLSEDAELPSTADGLPRDYFFVGADGALGYRNLSSAEDAAPARELQPGFAVSVTETRASPRGEPFSLTTKGLWLPSRNLVQVHPLVFRGYDVDGGKLDRGWVVVDAAKVYAEPNTRPKTGVVQHRFETVPILELRDVKGRRWVRIGSDAWLDASDLRIPELASPPPEARPNERWIDVDLASQVVIAYEGTRPVFATLSSTGVGHGSEPTATPLGVHRVWVKLRATDMTNLEDEEALRYYAMQEVPWVLFFEKGYGFHGAFWHRSFGHTRSHGCVNLTPIDAEHLFRWASPRLPAGWTAVLPTDYDPGTLVRVR